MDLPTSETLPIVVSTLAASVSLLAGLVGLFGWVRGRLRRAPHRTVTLCPDDDWLASNDVSNIAATQNLLVSNKPGVTNRTDAFIWLGAFLDDQVEALARFGHDRRDLAGHHIYVPHFGAGPSQRHLAKPESWLVQAAIAAENLRSYLRDTRCTRVYVIGFSAGADLAVCIGPYLANSGLDTHIVALDANTSQRTTFLTSAVHTGGGLSEAVDWGGDALATYAATTLDAKLKRAPALVRGLAGQVAAGFGASVACSPLRSRLELALDAGCKVKLVFSADTAEADVSDLHECMRGRSGLALAQHTAVSHFGLLEGDLPADLIFDDRRPGGWQRPTIDWRPAPSTHRTGRTQAQRCESIALRIPVPVPA